jgi:hypothetical protein
METPTTPGVLGDEVIPEQNTVANVEDMQGQGMLNTNCRPDDMIGPKDVIVPNVVDLEEGATLDGGSAQSTVKQMLVSGNTALDVNRGDAQSSVEGLGFRHIQTEDAVTDRVQKDTNPGPALDALTSSISKDEKDFGTDPRPIPGRDDSMSTATLQGSFSVPSPKYTGATLFPPTPDLYAAQHMKTGESLVFNTKGTDNLPNPSKGPLEPSSHSSNQIGMKVDPEKHKHLMKGLKLLAVRNLLERLLNYETYGITACSREIPRKEQEQ